MKVKQGGGVVTEKGDHLQGISWGGDSLRPCRGGVSKKCTGKT